MAIRTYYEILGVSPQADDREIRRAYRRAMRQHHPDQHSNDPKGARRSRELNAAKDVLLNPKLRRKYDEKLRKEGRLGDEKPASEIPDDLNAKAQAFESASEVERPEPTTGFGFNSSRETCQTASRKRARFASRETVFNLIGVVLGGVAAVLVAWWIMETAWFRDFRASLNGRTPVAGKFAERISDKKETGSETGPIEESKIPAIEPPPVDDLQEQIQEEIQEPLSGDETNSQDSEEAGIDELEVTTEDANRDEEPKPVIEIVNARFGTGRRWVDVTESIKSVLERDPPEFLNSARGLNASDPLSGYKKKTIITFRIDGQQKQITLPAGPNQRFNLADQLK